jgi:hypothetical protein
MTLHSCLYNVFAIASSPESHCSYGSRPFKEENHWGAQMEGGPEHCAHKYESKTPKDRGDSNESRDFPLPLCELNPSSSEERGNVLDVDKDAKEGR